MRGGGQWACGARGRCGRLDSGEEYKRGRPELPPASSFGGTHEGNRRGGARSLRAPSCNEPPLDSVCLLTLACSTLKKVVASALIFLSGAALLPSCAVWVGTPMPGSENCRYRPTVEECQATADRIEDYCLRNCVVRLCRSGKTECNETIQLDCVQRSGAHELGGVGGWVKRGPQTCEHPREDISWCGLPLSPHCQELTMVHELAHACGWHHGDGSGVPGDSDGVLKCR